MLRARMRHVSIQLLVIVDYSIEREVVAEMIQGLLPTIVQFGWFSHYVEGRSLRDR